MDKGAQFGQEGVGIALAVDKGEGEVKVVAGEGQTLAVLFAVAIHRRGQHREGFSLIQQEAPWP